LSGFVLTISLQKRPLSYVSFACKRFCRIYPAFAVTIALSYVLHYWIGAPNNFQNPFLDAMSEVDLSLQGLLRHLCLLGTQEDMRLDIVMWSLVHELRISFLFPLIFASVVQYRAIAVAAYGLLSLGCTVLSYILTGQISNGIENSVPASLLASAFFIVFFAAGAWLAVEREAVVSSVSKLSGASRFIVIAAVAGCLLKSGRNPHALTGIISDYVVGLGAVGLVALALGMNRFQSMLSHRTSVWFGEISYSLYLVHVPILYALSQLFRLDSNLLLLNLAIVATSLLVAYAGLCYVELPSIRLGNWIVSNGQTARPAQRPI
jgi:peptidoglycan/LPS O-acetylase OafA/YrhL